MTSYSTADRGPTIARTESEHLQRNLKAFAVMAALLLTALTYLVAELSLTLSPRHASHPSVLVDSALVMPKHALRPSEGQSIIPLQASLGPAAWRGAEDPIGAYVSGALGLAPATIEYIVSPGDTLLRVFGKLNIGGEDTQAVIAALRSANNSDDLRIRPEQRMTFELGGTMHRSDARPLLSASIRLDAERKAEIKRDISGAYSAAITHDVLTPHPVLARGVIDSSLAGAAGDQGVPDAVIAQFANIYSYDVDFQRDIQRNDTFEIYYTEYTNADGDVAQGRSDILYARLAFEGKVKTYYRFTTTDGNSDYYDATGKSARTFLMRTPVDGARISSGYGMRRHPVLGYSKMHKGVDFAAPSGTHVYAAGAGVVERASRFGTYGNYIRIRHANGYSTAYAHLSAFGRGIKPGTRVTQGQLIGYVGSTGRSTGPHLHYEVMLASDQINPMSVKVPTGIKLAGKDLESFKAQIARIDLAMKAAKPAQLASAEAQPSADRAR